MTLRGMAWDHPRAYQPLEAFAKECPSPAVSWDRQSLADFDARPLTELARQYDLMIVDHPGLGAAITAGAIQPLRRLVPQEVLDGWKGSSFGPTWDSYVVGGQPWALPVDAATQVPCCGLTCCLPHRGAGLRCRAWPGSTGWRCAWAAISPR
jgi:multiple sugar transport system substrate-binding protein